MQNTECEPFETKGLLDLFVLFYAMARSAPPSQQVYEGQWKLDKAHGEGECAMVVPLRSFEEKIIRAGLHLYIDVNGDVLFFKASIRIPFHLLKMQIFRT